MIESIEKCIARTPDPDDHWLWCIECNRFFHYSRLIDRDTSWPRCPFSDCTGYGWDFHIFFWNQFREPRDPRWPSRASELRHGMRSPEMHGWYQARFLERRELLVARFDASDENQAAGGEPSRYVRPFLTLSHDISTDLTDPDDDIWIEELAAELIVDLPVWADTADPSEAPRMVAELRRFFDFAERTAAIPNPAAWRGVVADDDLVERFRTTMATDRRLRPRPPRRRAACSASPEDRRVHRNRRRNERKKRRARRRRRRHR